jgi:acetyltransferase-like isoleucine patch superfamily enzyme
VTALWGRLKARLAGERRPAADPSPSPPVAPAPPCEVDPDLPALAEGLEHGAFCPPSLLAGLETLMRRRRSAAAASDGPSSPRTTALRVIRADLPSWWSEGANLLLAGEGAQPPDLRSNPFLGPPRGAVVVIGEASRFDHVNLAGERPLVVIGDKVLALAGALSCYGPSAVLLGEQTTCTNWAMVDCRNGGIIVAGADGMWAHGVSLMTDDTHAIRDAVTGERLNAFGGRIVIGDHVWLCEQVRVMGGARIGANAIVGAGSLVRGRAVADHTVAVGVPVRPVRSGVTWSREDLP